MGRPKTDSTTTEERKKRKRERERKRYQKIKGDPVLYAQYQLKNKAKYEKRKAQKKVVSIKDMTPRARRVQRKKWREAFNAYYKRKKDAKAASVKFMESNSPPDSEAEVNNELQCTIDMNVANRNSPSPSILTSASILSISMDNKENTNPNSRITRSQKSPLSHCRSYSQFSETSSVSSRGNSPSQLLIRKLRYKKDKVIKELTRQLEGVKKVNAAYRKKIKRMTEEKKESSMDIINDKLLQSYKALKTHKAKQEFSKNLQVNIKNTLKDKGRLGKLTNIFRRRVSKQKGSKVKKIREDVKKFLEEDENSSVTAGKKETVKKAGVIKQRRYDIPDFDVFVEELKTNTKNILIETVSDYDIIEKDILLPTDLRSFKGSQKVHQVIWNDSDKYQVKMRNLSCVEKACIIQPRCCSHVEYLGSHILRSEILSNPSNPDQAHEIENPNPSNISSVIPIQRSYAFCARSEADLPEELMPETATMASDVRSECTDLSLPEEIIIQNLISMDSFNLPEADKQIDISGDVEILDVSLQTVTRSALDEPLAQQSSLDLTGLAISADSPVTTRSTYDVPLRQLSSSDMAVSLTSVRRPGINSSMPTTNSITCMKMCLSIAKPSTSKYVSPDIIRSQQRAGPSKITSKGRKKGNILTHKKIKEIRETKEKKRNKSATIVQKYSQETSRNKPKTKNQRKTCEETSSDEEMTLPPSPESDLYNMEDEAIETSGSEENYDSIDANEDNVHEGDWVVVKLVSQKNVVHHYVGQVVNESLASLDIKFAKKINDSRFKWPEKTDISVVGKYQVIKKLPPPYFKSSSKRVGAFEFPKSLRKLKIDK